MADEIVVFERRADENRRVDRQADDGQQAGARDSSQGKHYSPMIRVQRPTINLKRAATPPRSSSPACCETPAEPMMPVTRVYCTSAPTLIQVWRRKSAPPLRTKPAWRTSTSSPVSLNCDVSVYL